MNLSIAIDGPAGSGKSTIAKILSKKYNLMYINTGAMYRAVTYLALEKNIFPKDTSDLVNMVENMEMHFENDRLILNGKDINDYIYTPYISNNVSSYAAILEVREKLVILQKKIAQKYNVIMDGRDIGTVVLKDAPYKFFITASPQMRAKRRYDELIMKNINVEYKDVLNDIIKRDYVDSNRDVNPLKMAKDAILIDTSDLTIEEVIKEIDDHIN